MASLIYDILDFWCQHPYDALEVIHVPYPGGILAPVVVWK